MNLVIQAQNVKKASVALRGAGEARRNEALAAMAQALRDHCDAILSGNAKDLAAAKEKGLSTAFIERLTLTPARVEAMAQGVEDLIALPDPLGITEKMWTRPNGIVIGKRRVPLGVVGIIFESRPNVASDAAAICLKSGNACLLRGGSDAIHSNTAIVDALRGAIESVGLPCDCVELVRDTSREVATQMMRLNESIDVLIPRGGAGLIQSVVQNATVPVIQTGTGNCHVYVDGKCDRAMAQKIAVSAKVSRPSVCNSAETLLVDAAIAEEFLPACLNELHSLGVEIRGCEKTQAIAPWVTPAAESDWATEYNDLIYAVRVVDGLEAAIAHIEQYSTHHSEAIITSDYDRALRFMDAVDSACVYVNASTRFTDGGEFGFGAEIGISNQKLHARGPMGLCEMTTTKYVIFGNGQVR